MSVGTWPTSKMVPSGLGSIHGLSLILSLNRGRQWTSGACLHFREYLVPITKVLCDLEPRPAAALVASQASKLHSPCTTPTTRSTVNYVHRQERKKEEKQKTSHHQKHFDTYSYIIHLQKSARAPTHSDSPTAQKSTELANQRDPTAKSMAPPEPGYAGSAGACAEPRKSEGP